MTRVLLPLFLLAACALPATAQPSLPLPPIPLEEEASLLEALDRARFVGDLELSPGRKELQVEGGTIAVVTTVTTRLHLELDASATLVEHEGKPALRLTPTGVVLSAKPPIVVGLAEGQTLVLSSLRSGAAAKPGEPPLRLRFAYGLADDLLRRDGALKLRAFARFSQVRLDLRKGAVLGEGAQPWIVAGASKIVLRDLSGPSAAKAWRARRAALELQLCRRKATKIAEGELVRVALAGAAELREGRLCFAAGEGSQLSAANLRLHGGSVASAVDRLQIVPAGVQIEPASGAVSLEPGLKGSLAGLIVGQAESRLRLAGTLGFGLNGGAAVFTDGALRLAPQAKACLVGKGLRATLTRKGKQLQLGQLAAQVTLGRRLSASLKGQLSLPGLQAGLAVRALGLLTREGKLELQTLSGRASLPLSALQQVAKEQLRKELAQRRGQLFSEITYFNFKYRNGSVEPTAFRLHPTSTPNELAFGLDALVRADRRRLHISVFPPKSEWRENGHKDLATGSLSGSLRVSVAPGPLCDLVAGVDLLGGVIKARPNLTGWKWIKVAHNFHRKVLASHRLKLFKPGQIERWPELLRSARVESLSLQSEAGSAHVDFVARLAP